LPIARPGRDCGLGGVPGRLLEISLRHGQAARRQVQDRPGGPPPALSVSRRDLRRRPIFNNTEEWWLSIPAEARPRKDQPFYHLFAENAETEYIAYVSEQNLLADTSGEPIRHPQVAEVFERDGSGAFRPRNTQLN